MSYSGTANFDYDIERMKHKETGEIVMLDSVADEDDTYEYVCLTLKVSGRSYFTDGRSWGPPENCFPDEGETEITSILLDDKDVEDMLSGKERETVLDKIGEIASEGPSEPDESDYDDDYDYEVADEPSDNW